MSLKRSVGPIFKTFEEFVKDPYSERSRTPTLDKLLQRVVDKSSRGTTNRHYDVGETTTSFITMTSRWVTDRNHDD